MDETGKAPTLSTKPVMNLILQFCLFFYVQMFPLGFKGQLLASMWNRLAN
jgi:hypothetical protein